MKHTITALGAFLFAAAACTVPVEGQSPGDCTNDADDDADGRFDCDDDGCAGASACQAADTQFQGPYLVINEVCARPAGDAPDWVELHNAGSESAGGALCLHVPFTEIGPGEFLVIEPFDACGLTLGSSDQVGLYDSEGHLIDRVDWEGGDSPEGASYGRLPDAVGDFLTLAEPTPGASNATSDLLRGECDNGVIEPGEVCDGEDLGGQDCASLGFAGGETICYWDCSGVDLSACVPHASDVVINEIAALNRDFIELSTLTATSIEGWSIVDRVAETPARAHFLSGTVEPSTYPVIYPEEFNIAESEWVILRDADGLVRGARQAPGCLQPDTVGEWDGWQCDSPGEPNTY